MNGAVRDWLFSTKTFAAAMIALGIGFASDLDRPYWAMASAYIASQPNVGATRSKAIYRLMGTVLGAAAAVALVPNLVDAPNLLIAGLCGWLALTLTLALLDRTPRSYVFMLAGYTAAIIGFPSVETPGDIFATAVARTEEIALGVVCATLVSSLVFPVHAGPIVLARMAAWRRDALQSAAERLRSPFVSPESEQARRRLAADVVDIGLLSTQLPFDAARTPIPPGVVGALNGRLLMLLPIVASTVSRISALRAAGGASPQMVGQVEEAIRLLESDAGPEAFGAFGASITWPESPSMDWRDLLEASLRERLRDLAALLHDCGVLLRRLEQCQPGMPELIGGVEVEAASLRHSDPLMALYSGISAAVAVGLICVFWRAAAWPEGAAAAELAAVGCCFFAAQDDPAPAIFRFLDFTIVAVLVDGVYLFGVLPAVDGFPMLVMALAPAFLVYGWLAARPSTAAAGLALSANGATLMALQSAYAADFASFANSGVAVVLGMAAAAVVTRLIRSVGADWSAWRLVRANWVSLAAAARGRGRGDRSLFAGLLIERIGLIAGRAGAMTEDQAPNLGKMAADLRIGLNIIELRRARRAATPAVVAVIDSVLDGVAGYYERLARGRLGRPDRGPDPDGVRRIDEAISAVVSEASEACERDAVKGLVGVRLGLYPDAPPYRSPPTPDPTERREAA